MTVHNGDVWHLLLIEDNPGDADLIQELLGGVVGPAPEVTHTLDLGSAVSLLSKNEVDAVLLDLFLPDSSGVECVKTLRSCARAVPIVVLTGVDDTALALRCIEAGAQDYISKQELRAQSLNRTIKYAIARTREAALHQRADALQRRLAAIVEASRDGIVSTTPAGVITSWNGGAERILGYSSADAVGRALQTIMRPIDAAASVEQERLLEQARAGSDSTEPVEVTRLRNDGAALTLSLVACNLRDAAGELIGLAAIFRDVTDNKRRDDELRRRNEELTLREQQMRALAVRLNAVREQERTRISREVHDELGQLLTGIKMDLRWIARRLDEQAAAERILGRLAEADKLVDRTIASVQRIAVELRPSALDALGLAAALRDEARRFEKSTGISARVQVKGVSNPEPEVATALFRIFQELLTNVARHARARSIHVELDEIEGSFSLRVEDDGIGIGAGDSRLPQSLGLLGMNERAQAVGGSISLERGMQGGTVATVCVPRGKAEDACATC